MEKALKVSTFRERFYELISSGDKTMKDFSKDLHVSNQTISAWKTGARSPKEPTIIAIANHFGVSVQWLMGFDVPKHIRPELNLSMFNGENAADPDISIVSGMMESMTKEQKEQIVAIVRAVVTHQAK